MKNFAIFAHMNLENFGNTPFRMQDLSSVFTDCANLAMKAKRLERDGNIIRLKKGLYVVNPNISHIELSPFLVANHIHGPSYVSMQTALRHYGLIPEAVYAVQSITTGIARDYTNSLGYFTFTHAPTDHFNVGVTIKNESKSSFLIATPEKALCDLIAYTPRLNLRYQSEIYAYLEEDIRFDMDSIRDLNLDIIEACIETSKKKTMLRQLIKTIKNEQIV